MKDLDLKTSRPAPGRQERLGRLVRHLDARLRDFGPGGPEVLLADQASGVVAARFPGRSAGEVVERLARECRIRAGLDGDAAVFRLSPDVPFEELDRLWGCLFKLLS